MLNEESFIQHDISKQMRQLKAMKEFAQINQMLKVGDQKMCYSLKIILKHLLHQNNFQP